MQQIGDENERDLRNLTIVGKWDERSALDVLRQLQLGLEALIKAAVDTAYFGPVVRALYCQPEQMLQYLLGTSSRTKCLVDPGILSLWQV